ncbi:MAG TPA: LysM peptidoglycan-binding domain-containing protein [Bacteroidota bacterium]|nr:LysM peptidoglycan-binding domain-containing protein [Bacteroidota bacterium]
MLQPKYQPAIDMAKEMGFSGVEVSEVGGKLKIKATAQYQFDKDLFWDKLKTIPNWNNEVEVNVSVMKSDVYGYYTVKSGDTLSKLAKAHLGDAKRYMEIFNLNTAILKDPDLIKVGQRLQLPKK